MSEPQPPVQPDTEVPFLDRLLTPDQFCAWAGVGRRWFSARVDRLPGVVMHSRQFIRVHPRTYLAATTQSGEKP